MNTEPRSNQPSSACEELRDLIPAYTIGATTQAETERVQALLPQCPEVAADLRETLALAQALTETVEPIAPPPSLRTKLLAQVAAEAAAQDNEIDTATRSDSSLHVLDATPTLPTAPTRNNRIAWWLSAAAAALLIITNIFWLSQWQALRGAIDATRAELVVANDQLETVNAELETASDALESAREREDEIRDFIRSPQLEIVRLQNAEQTQVVATLLWDQATNTAQLNVNDLPPVVTGETYQVWLIGADGPTSAGLFQTDEERAGSLQFTATQALQTYNTIGISVEPSGGSAAPTTTPLAVGTVPATSV